MSLFQYLKKATVPLILAGALVGGSVNSGLSQDSLEAKVEQTQLTETEERAKYGITEEQLAKLRKLKELIKEKAPKIGLSYDSNGNSPSISYSIDTSKCKSRMEEFIYPSEQEYDGSNEELHLSLGGKPQIIIDFRHGFIWDSNCDGIQPKDYFWYGPYWIDPDVSQIYDYPDQKEFRTCTDEDFQNANRDYSALLDNLINYLESECTTKPKPKKDFQSLDQFVEYHNIEGWVEIGTKLKKSEEGEYLGIDYVKLDKLAITIDNVENTTPRKFYERLKQTGFLKEIEKQAYGALVKHFEDTPSTTEVLKELEDLNLQEYPKMKRLYYEELIKDLKNNPVQGIYQKTVLSIEGKKVRIPSFGGEVSGFELGDIRLKDDASSKSEDLN